MRGLIGKKIGMTRIFDTDGNVVPVTVLEAGPCYVVQVKTVEADGYNAVKLSFGEKKNPNQPHAGQFKKTGIKPGQKLVEFEKDADQEVNPGDEIKVDIFNTGEKIKVTGWSKGRGFAGVIKRYGFQRGPKTHGQSDTLRTPGSVGNASYPSKVFKGKKMPGRMGNDRVSVKNLKVVKVDAEKNLLFVKGAVPGARNGFVEIHKAK